MIWEFFTDPVLRAPTWGCMLMCIASSLMGVLVFLRKKSLLSETLSHASYPGACLGLACFAFFFPQSDEWTFIAVLFGAFLSSFLALKAVQKLESEKVNSDAALTFILAVFFGLGVVIMSGLQSTAPIWARQAQMLLFGQAATMSDIHIWVYGFFAAIVSFFLFLTFRPLQVLLFDPDFAKSTKIPVIALEKIVVWLLVISLIIGIRSVGVVLMSGMVIAPAVAARQFSNRLQTVLLLAAFFGALSGFLGNILSVLKNLPNGPAIVLVGTFIALFSLLFSPKKGLIFRNLRIWAFRMRCVEENLLKSLWKKGKVIPSSWSEKMALRKLEREGWVDKKWSLTLDGKKKAISIVRLHRLWELYLAEELGFQAEKVHRTAEEMEHILTDEMEKKLTQLLEDPKCDPHQQPIPEREL